MNQPANQSCIDACNACADACDFCAASCLQEQDVKMMAKCIGLDMEDDHGSRGAITRLLDPNLAWAARAFASHGVSRACVKQCFPKRRSTRSSAGVGP
jgi:hypothetical protein